MPVDARTGVGGRRTTTTTTRWGETKADTPKSKEQGTDKNTRINLRDGLRGG